MNTKSKIILTVAVILIILVIMTGNAGPEEIGDLKKEYSQVEIFLGLLFLSSFLWIPLILALFAPSMTR